MPAHPNYCKQASKSPQRERADHQRTKVSICPDCQSQQKDAQNLCEQPRPSQNQQRRKTYSFPGGTKVTFREKLIERGFLKINPSLIFNRLIRGSNTKRRATK